METDGNATLIQFEPAFALHAYMNLTNISYETENSWFSSFMSSALPAIILADDLIVNGYTDIFRILNKADVSHRDRFAVQSSELLVCELNNVLFSIPSVRSTKFKLCRNIVAFDFGWLRLAESCNSYFEGQKHGNIVSSDVGDAEQLNSKLLRLHTLYLEIESALHALSFTNNKSSLASEAAPTPAKDLAWSVTCDALLFDHVMTLVLYASKEFSNDAPQLTTSATTEGSGAKCSCGVLFSFLRIHCPFIYERVESIASRISTGRLSAAFGRNRFIATSVNHKLLVTFLRLDERDGNSSAAGGTVQLDEPLTSVDLCQVPKFRLELSMASLTRPVYRTGALLKLRWKSLRQFVLQRNASKEDDSDRAEEHLVDSGEPGHEACVGQLVDLRSGPVVTVQFWDVLFGTMVLSSFVGFSMSRR